MKIKIFLILSFLFITHITYSKVKQTPISNGSNEFLNELHSNNGSTDSFSIMNSKLNMEKMRTALSQEKYYQKLYDSYYTKNLEHRWNTFNWQYHSGIVIFWVIIFIVISGIVFSGIQFYFTLKQLKIKEKLLSQNIQNLSSDTDNKNEIEISLQGIKLNSSILGVIILVISIAFFYLYLVYVYPIKPVNTDSLKIQTVTTQGK